MNRIFILPPLIIYLFIMLFIAYTINKKQNVSNFKKEYFIGNRSLNGLTLAMTILSTYIGASTFISGPSVVNGYGLSWVLLATIQLPIIFLTLGVVGKKIAVISRRIKAVTIIDILKERYKNKILINIISVFLLIFLVASTIGQFIGGARLLQTILGIDYSYALIFFSFVIIIYSSIGGFKTVAILDTIQSIVMVVSILVIFIVLYNKLGGFESITRKVVEVNPNLITPYSGGKMKLQYILSFYVLVGIGLLGLPSTTVRCMSFKNTKSMHNAMIYGSLVLGFIVIGIHMIGYMSIAMYPNTNLGDNLIPYISVNSLPKFLVGIFIGGPLAAIMSTIDSTLILISSTVVKDIYLENFNKNLDGIKLKKITLVFSFMIGFIVFLLAYKPFSLIVWINIFSLAGQELIFFIPLVLGLYTDKITDMGAISSILFGTITYLLLSIFNIDIFYTHKIIPSIIMAILGLVILNSYGKKMDSKTYKIFFE